MKKRASLLGTTILSAIGVILISTATFAAVGPMGEWLWA